MCEAISPEVKQSAADKIIDEAKKAELKKRLKENLTAALVYIKPHDPHYSDIRVIQIKFDGELILECGV